MKKLPCFFISFFVFLLLSCTTDRTFSVHRIRSNLNLNLNDETSAYECNWYVFKTHTDDNEEINAGDTVYFKLKATSDYGLPEVKAYFAELRDPNLNSREELKATEEEDSTYVAATSQWVPVSEEFTLLPESEADEEINTEISTVMNYDILDNTKTVMFVYLKSSDLPEDYFSFFDELLAKAEAAAQKKAEAKAAKMNKKEGLTEDSEDYHTAEEYYDDYLEKELDSIGDENVRISDVKLDLEILSSE